MIIGSNMQQPSGYQSFIPEKFPSEGLLIFPQEILVKSARAEWLVGKLDGIAHTLPDANFFLSMYVIKDATHSAQIEGTRASLLDALEMSAGVNVKDTDADDILHYIDTLNYGIRRLNNLPISLRFLRELHRELMTGDRATHYADPGEFRKTQNWIGGTSPENASFVPPPVAVMHEALYDLEQFMQKKDMLPVLQAGLIHAQFETIHPFLDGNGRTGRLLVTLFLYERALLEKPLLFLSSYFKKHRQLYYDKLNAYHNNRPWEWLNFYLDGVIETATQSIETSKKIAVLCENDLLKIQALGKREAGSGVTFLQSLFKNPVTNVSITMNQMQFSRPGAQKLIDRFVELGILKQLDESVRYGRTYIYDRYIQIFND